MLFGSHLQTVREVVDAQRATVPKPVLAYHKITEDPLPEDPGNFKIERVNSIYFVPAGKSQAEPNPAPEGEEPQGVNVLQTQLAHLVPARQWASHATSVLYSTKWSASGLMPIRPQVVLTTTVTLPPGACLALQ